MLEPDSLAVVEVSMLSPFTTLSDDSPGMGEFMRLDLQPLQLQFIIIQVLGKKKIKASFGQAC